MNGQDKKKTGSSPIKRTEDSGFFIFPANHLETISLDSSIARRYRGFFLFFYKQLNNKILSFNAACCKTFCQMFFKTHKEDDHRDSCHKGSGKKILPFNHIKGRKLGNADGYGTVALR